MTREDPDGYLAALDEALAACPAEGCGHPWHHPAPCSRAGCPCSHEALWDDR